MKDQKQLWNDAHMQSALAAFSKTHTNFAEDCNQAIPAGANILELGCGDGNDSIYFAEQGHQVIATDFAEVTIDANKHRYNNPNLQFIQQDISAPLDFKDEQFDVVYARLSLHYFTDEVTGRVFDELARVLKAGGLLCFMCKSTEDRLYGKGDLIEQDMYELDGHVRHFFSEAYARKLLAKNFTVTSLQTGQEDMYGKVSGFVKVIATKN